MKNAPKRWTPRVTVAAIVENEGRFLVVEEVPDPPKSVINQPAGHLENGESLLQAVVREVQEETAWHFEPEAITGIYRWTHPQKDRTYLRFCFCGRVDKHQPEQPLDPKILRTHWLSLDELRTRPLRSPMVLRCVEDYLAGRRYPLSLCTDLTGTP